MTQIGLLIPRSAIFPTMNFEFMEGLKTSLSNRGITDIEIKTAGIGLGASDKEIYTACEKLIFDGVEIIVGYINPGTAKMMQPLFVNANALLIMLTAGYQVHEPGYKPENTFSITLDGTLACRILPAIAAKKGDTRFAFAYSFFDAGFRVPFGFFNGVADAGSQILFVHGTQLKRTEFTIEPLTAHMKANADTALMLASCGDMTTDFFGGMEADTTYTGIHMYAAPFVAEEVWLPKSPWPGADVTAIVPWGSGLTNAGNEAFTAAMKKKNRAANLFSLLTWEAGELIAKALESDNTADRIKLLENYSFGSPRGTVTIDKDTHESHAPLYVAIIKENEATGMCTLVMNEEVPTGLINDNRKKLQQEIENIEGNSTSWFNVYGCMDS